MSEEVMRAELSRIRFIEDDEDGNEQWLHDTKGESTYVAFTAIHPTELTLEGTPQEYGVGVAIKDFSGGPLDIPGWIQQGAWRSLVIAGCLTGEWKP